MVDIDGFPGYKYEDGVVYKPNGDVQKLLKGNTPKRSNFFYKMKNAEGKWVQVTRDRIKSIVGEILGIPEDAKQIYQYENYYIDTDGNVYSFSRSNPTGKKLSPRIDTAGYLSITLKGKPRTVHSLLAETFIMHDYREKGLCVMHIDNNKLNCKLSNIKVGTYSENNKQAYKDGINKGRKTVKTNI